MRPDLKHLRHFELALAVDKDRGLQRPCVKIGRGGMADTLVKPILGLWPAGVEEMPEPVRPLHHRSGPSGQIVKGGACGRRKGDAKLFPIDQIIADRVALRHVEMAQVGVTDTPVGLEEMAVPAGAIMGIPAIPRAASEQTSSDSTTVTPVTIAALSTKRPTGAWSKAA